MRRIALLSSEPIRERMAGIGIRYLELARRLPRHPGLAGGEVVLVSPAEPAQTAELGLESALTGIRGHATAAGVSAGSVWRRSSASRSILPPRAEVARTAVQASTSSRSSISRV